jgi:ketosteroid isomerase-like protein
MKTMSALCLFIALLSGASVDASERSEAEILKLEQDFNAAYAENQLDKYFGFYADDAVLWFPEGRTDIPSYKKEWTAFLKTGAHIQSGVLSDEHIRLSPDGDCAIASYVLHLKTVGTDKKIADELYQESDVWFKTPTGWKISHVHYSHAPVATAK